MSVKVKVRSHFFSKILVRIIKKNFLLEIRLLVTNLKLLTTDVHVLDLGDEWVPWRLSTSLPLEELLRLPGVYGEAEMFWDSEIVKSSEYFVIRRLETTTLTLKP